MMSGVITAILIVLFVGGWIWLWRPRHKKHFDDAAQLPLNDDEDGGR